MCRCQGDHAGAALPASTGDAPVERGLRALSGLDQAAFARELRPSGAHRRHWQFPSPRWGALPWCSSEQLVNGPIEAVEPFAEPIGQ
jgi:hypothetical protein